MRVLVLGAHGERLLPTLQANGDELAYDNPDWLISFGYQHIIAPAVIAQFPGRIINLHIGYLPWNRGADPNFWSWYDATPKGVTIHQITKGLDTGPILAQREVAFANAGHTLRSSYDVLMRDIVALFACNWAAIRAGELAPRAQPAGGSYHRSADKAALMKTLALGWDTPCEAVAALGAKARILEEELT